MAATILDGKALAQARRAQIQEEVARFRAETGIPPGLAVVLVGDDPASRIYVRNKERACQAVGIASEQHHLPSSTSQAQLLSLIDRLNRDPRIHGILVQLPLPPHIDERAVIEAIHPAKDVDGFHPANVARLVLNQEGLRPCTPAGILALLDHAGVPLAGTEAVVVGRSNIVGKPLAMMLLHRDATVTLCHSRTRDLAAVCRRADLVVAAVGRAELIRGDWIKPGAAVIDVGINRQPDGSLKGDVAFDEAVQVAGAITPVPGGVGPMTITMLLENTLQAARQLAAGPSEATR
ncbi:MULTISPECIES: bifunctional methylenetetrahydrofolate dehydrogenase/methenyltetrahydrofolate cyclohydrolase FolD [Limnochorda]|uniref:bifunctional methylenetetrahydrofolate dehydrogenase/methenyltetrahydrofolate cyclohydrolase FolD n=1 Tax=Limnochorda TaxID=1676651 RepID=UPI001E020EEE|nr:bifunctional methylenetetrahydrofolate dehydrogenase/methenyltetrahydrofolate cyclohydrolase FolD [Limnochorda pilosa]MBO2485856.1 bifunctional methylenetetrahydrofolate dehydrogenase/methenyltetrahydrofolate cyclohydrolase FolD [Bacillota bacterium]MBO2519206.1 bifunctional methylenetetrahydrofolate dehydrogenase/methenyltetrahydrofolate cyclohydrolase FolD [Bacillota bacterium]